MRRAFPVAILSALLAIAPAALAQHGNAGHAGGFGGGHIGGFHGGFSAPRSFGGYSGFAGSRFAAVPRMSYAAPRYNMAPGRASAYRPAYGADRHGWDRGRNRYRPSYGGYGAYNTYPYGWVNSWELLPLDLGDSDFYGDDDSAQPSQPAAAAQQPPPDEYQGPPPGEYPGPPPEQDYRQDFAPPPPAYDTAAAPAAPIAPEPRLTLIFKDGHTEQIRNYVLTPESLIVLDEAASGREPQIPLSELNVPATEQAAQQAGLEFSPPAS